MFAALQQSKSKQAGQPALPHEPPDLAGLVFDGFHRFSLVSQFLAPSLPCLSLIRCHVHCVKTYSQLDVSCVEEHSR